MSEHNTTTEAPGVDPEATTPDDADGHAAAIEQYREDRADREAQLSEQLSIKERLEQAAAEKTHTVDVGKFVDEPGLEVEFTRLSSEKELRLMSIARRFKSLDDDGIETLYDELTELRDEVAEILANNTADEALRDPTWWTDTFSTGELVMTGSAIAEGNEEVSPEEIEGFRDK